MNKRLFFFYCFMSMFLISCVSNTTRSSISMKKKPDEKTEQGTSIIAAPIVEKKFVKKNGVELDFSEYYIQRSIQDYFIKFCEGKVTRAQLKEALDKKAGPMKSLKLEVEFRKGLWDVCDGNHDQQSRVGDYVVLWNILE